MKNRICIKINKSLSLVSVIVGSVLLLIVLLPVYGQESFSPAEEAVGESVEQQQPQQQQQKQQQVIDVEEGVSAIDAVEGVSIEQPRLWQNETSGQLYANSSVNFILEAKDNLSRLDYIEYKINDGEFARYTTPLSFSSEGTYDIIYRSFDRAGNREANRSFNVIIDNTPPEVALTPAKAFIKVNERFFTSPGNTFSIRSTDHYSGVRAIIYGVNASPNENYVEGSIIQLSDPGSQLIQYKAVDNLGNISKEASILVEVDNIRPKISIRTTHPLREVDTDLYARRNTGFMISAEDKGAGIATIMMRLDGGEEWQTYTDTLYFAAEKNHAIEAKAIDSVGNESEVVTFRFIVDDNPPLTKIHTSVE